MITLTIRTLNSKAEGISVELGETVSIPLTLPGESVQIEERYQSKGKRWGRVLKVLTPSPQRQNPACPHYGTCGGCVLQHLEPKAYTAYKKSLVVDALKAQGLPTEGVEDPLIIGPHKRRRIDFKARRWDEGIILGFTQLKSQRPFQIEVCPAVTPAIEALFLPLKLLCEEILNPKEMVHFFITEATNGIDLLLAGFKRPLTPEEEKTLVAFAQTHKLARLTYKVKKRATELFCPDPPYVVFGDHRIAITPAGFLQATAESDHIFGDFVRTQSTGATKAADLFCGRGTLSLALTQKCIPVDGYECDPHALAALQAASDPLLTVTSRNLFDSPLTAQELAPYDLVVMNPPRAGADTQATELKDSAVRKIIYISCNATSFARDCHTLSQGGFHLKTVAPVDQFLWSPHIEVMAMLERP